jgi:tetratricopeptide (TPR) repeat protein
MNHEEARDALSFGEVYRRARAAGAGKCPPFDLQRGLNELLTWMDQEVEIVEEAAVDQGLGEPAPSGRRMKPDVPAIAEIQRPQARPRGRRKLLDDLLVLVRKPEDGPAVLAGVGGAGKSTVAAALAQQVRGRGRQVWWVSAANPASLSAGLVRVAQQVGGSPLDIKAIALGTADAPDRFWRLLERAPREWLLVFDNADDPWMLAARESPAGVQDSTGWARSSRRGLALVTSREADPRIWGAAQLHVVGQLDEADAAQVLRDLAPAAGDEEQARVLARRLGGLPLTLHLAGTYLRSEVAQWSTFTAYDDALNSPVTQATQRAAGTMVTHTAEISLDGLARHGIPQARTVLRLASCFAPTSIPMDILDSPSMGSLLGPKTDSPHLQRLVGEALRGLRGVGLVQHWPAGSAAASTAITIHPVISDSNRTYLDGPEPDSGLIRRTAVDLLVTAIRKLRFDLPEGWPQYRLLGQHLLALLDMTAEYVDQEHLIMLMEATALAANAFNRSGAGKAANAMCRLALARCSALGNAHPASLRVRHQLAWGVANQGDLAEAEAMYQDILDIRLDVLGTYHPDILDSRHELAWVAACQGRWPQAESRYRQALHDNFRVLGPDEPRTLTTRHELAWVIANQNRLEEAHAAFHEVLQDRRRVLGVNHPQTLATRHELAWITARQGNWAEAESIYRNLLDLRRQILENDHPDTLLTAHELAWTTARQGRWAEAKSRYERVLERRRRTLGDDHPETQATQQALDELQHGRIVDAHHIV